MKTREKRSKILFPLLVTFVALAVALPFVSVFALGQTGLSFFGYRAFIILSDSMEKTDFAAGDLALVREVDPTTLREGDIISYISRNEENFGQTVTHKIRCRTTDADGEPAFITYGTSNDTDDPLPVSYPYILGKYQARIAYIGRFFLFLKTVPGYLLCIFLPFMLLLSVQIAHCFSLVHHYREAQRRALRAERLQLEIRQAQTEQMLERLNAMRAQMGLSEEIPPV